MKPFNLQEALAGKPVVTRNGKEVTGFTKFADLKEPFKYAAILAGEIYTFTAEGKFLSSKADNPHDLVMVVEKHQVFINIYPDTTYTGSVKNRAVNYGYTTGVNLFLTRAEADREQASSMTRLAVAVAEWEE